MDRCANVNRTVLVAFCGLLAATPVYADSEHKAKPASSHGDQDAILRHKLRDTINTGLVGIVSEGTDYTTDLALTLAAEQNGLRLLPVAGAGALQNAEDVMFARGIDFGIVQTDVLDQIKRNPPFPGVEKYLQYVTKLYDQDFHVLAGPDIQSIDDLRGKKVNFGLRDSGTYTTATTIFSALGFQFDVTTLPQPVALDKLRLGEISALVYVATKPSRLFQDIRPDEHLHFLPIRADMLPNYTPITINSDDYPDLVSKDAAVNTVAVGTVLVAYNWPIKSERYSRVHRFVEAFFGNLKDIKARRPKWRDFDVSTPVSGWTRFPAAEQWLKQAELIPEPNKAFASRNPVVGEATVQARVPLGRGEREALFRDFAEYRTQQQAIIPNHENPRAGEALFRDFAEYQKHQRMIIAYHETTGDH
jgi:uncharacterized protein